MALFNHVLVVIDPSQQEQKALSRAVEIARLTHCHLTVFLSIYDLSYEMTTMLSGEEREAMRLAVMADKRDWIDELMARYIPSGMAFNVTVEVVWHNRPFEAIIEHAKQGDYDLIVKATHPHDSLKALIFTPTDWHLLRKAPCAVLLVKEHAWPMHGKVLACINAGSQKDYHLQLNDRLIKVGSQMAALLEAELHCVNAYPGTPIQVAIEIPEFNAMEYSEKMLHHHQDALHRLAQHYSIAPNACHIKEGLPEDVIPRVAEQLDAEMVVIGTIGRTGLSAAIIGNTAEYVIDRLNCDVLALRNPLAPSV